MNDTSLSLLARVRQGDDSQSWDRLLELYAPLLRSWLQAYDVQDADADDLIQDVKRAALKFMAAMRIGLKRPRGWAFRTNGSLWRSLLVTAIS